MKTVCVYHSRDLDGWMSAAIVKYWWKQNIGSDPNITIEENLTSNTLISRLTVSNTIDESIVFIGYDYGQPIPNLKEYDRVIMVDVSFNKLAMHVMNMTQEVIYIDHHISAINDIFDENFVEGLMKGKRDTKFAACELTWQYFFPNDTIPEIVRLLGRYDCFGHKGTDEELDVLEFQYGARQVISNYEDAYNYLNKVLIGGSTENHHMLMIMESGRSIYKYLCTEAKQIYKRTFGVIFNLEQILDIKEQNIIKRDYSTREGIAYIPYKFLCVNQDRFNPINFGIDYHKDGYDGFACFWFANGKWNFSLYNDNGEVDCSLIAKQYGGGGHKGAAGFVTNDLKSILGI